MVRWVDILEVFVITLVTANLITPVIRRIAAATGYLDHPKQNKVHAHPTPLLGGLAIYIAFILGIVTTIDLSADPRLKCIVIGSFFLVAIGLVDDRFGMMPEVKLLAQFLAAMVVIKAGVRITFLGNYYADTIVTYLWIVGITNSFNLLDNMNGLSAGIAGIAALFFGVAMWAGGQYIVSAVAFALAGASIGFLRHNFPKAHIFMGDTGSLVLGYVLATTAVLGSWCTKFLSTSLAMPIIILAYPIFDTTLVTVMRLLERRSIFQGGKDHSSHRLALLGLRRRRAVLAIYGICIALGLSALVVQQAPITYALALICCVVVLMLSLGIRLALVDTGRYGRSKKEDVLD